MYTIKMVWNETIIQFTLFLLVIFSFIWILIFVEQKKNKLPALCISRAAFKYFSYSMKFMNFQDQFCKTIKAERIQPRVSINLSCLSHFVNLCKIQLIYHLHVRPARYLSACAGLILHASNSVFNCMVFPATFAFAQNFLDFDNFN